MASLSLRYQAVASIRHSYHVLTTEADLSPRNEAINQALTGLVRTLTHCLSPDMSQYLMTTPDLVRERDGLPSLCGMAECEMEKYWAKRFIESETCNLEDFWYIREYEELCKAEHALYAPRDFETISFLGAGALPLTAVFLTSFYPDAKITCVDFDAEACDLARGLFKRLGLSGRVNVLCMDAADYRPQSQRELVICASLLQGRATVYSNLEKAGCAALLVRDCESVYQYLYKAAEKPASSFLEIAHTDVHPKRINTSRYYETRRRNGVARAA